MSDEDEKYEVENFDPKKVYTGELSFDDGGQRGLAAAVVWLGLVYRVSKESKTDMCHAGVVQLATSLLAIPTMRKTQSSDMASEQIRRIIQQNVEAKKMAISSYEWASILSAMSKSTKLTLQEAVQLYNQNPQVAAHGGSGAKDGARKFRTWGFYFGFKTTPESKAKLLRGPQWHGIPCH